MLWRSSRIDATEDERRIRKDLSYCRNGNGDTKPPTTGEGGYQNLIGYPIRLFERLQAAHDIDRAEAETPAVERLPLPHNNGVKLAAFGCGSVTIKKLNVITLLSKQGANFQQSCWLDPVAPRHPQVNNRRID